ncbi:hypothetical protein [uncultured Aliiroseovarius sp.]|uniref:hypothetical protein n=1 Tax=uncultured Aliiroseovarius sp. TaxID=1658783 RepID=UPI002595FAE5|nr:hypothetical protein [uncultured Aliiroseovarius sp.]
MTEINLDMIAGQGRTRNLSGKERGVAARAQLELDTFDQTPDEISVVVPDYIDTISPSFFQGLFSQSIRALNGKEQFLSKYHFVANDSIKRWIEIGIRNASSSRGELI